MTDAATGDGSDDLLEIENLIGSTFDNGLEGDDGTNEIWGGNGADVIDGGGGDDRLLGFGDFNDATDSINGGRGRRLDRRRAWRRHARTVAPAPTAFSVGTSRPATT